MSPSISFTCIVDLKAKYRENDAFIHVIIHTSKYCNVVYYFQMPVSYDGISLHPHPKQRPKNVTKRYIRETYFYMICLPL